MKCSVLPTTSTVPDVGATSSSREAAAAFAAELTRVAFAPFAKALGFYGDVALAATARSLARRESGGLTDELERFIERAR